MSLHEAESLLNGHPPDKLLESLFTPEQLDALETMPLDKIEEIVASLPDRKPNAQELQQQVDSIKDQIRNTS